MEYFQKSLTWRKIQLNAPSESHLCKTIIMENKGFNEKYLTNN